MDRFELDWEGAAAEAARFIHRRVEAAGRRRGVLGLSGGIDSAVTAYLAARALGPSRVHALMMPYSGSSSESLDDARAIAEDLDLPHQVIDITPMIDAYFERWPDADRLRRANKMARERMAILYDQSERLDALVIGTGNRTEALLGYTTLWGDMACAFEPIGDLYKTQVRRLAEHLGIPERIIAKPPTADLWQGQTDEGELGFTYEMADRILSRLVDDGMTPEQVAAEGFDEEVVRQVARRMDSSAFKRSMPPSPPLRDAAHV
ncbi:MAG: NAD+ synthase [Armatimonadota bacterium]|nr:NAD+ synthase [Armatimonadota bacterium]